MSEDVEMGKSLGEKTEPDVRHIEITRQIPALLNREADLTPIVRKAATERRFLG